MDFVFLLGRILFALLFIGSGVGHLTDQESSTQYAASKNVPQPQNAVILSGVVMLVGGLSVVLGLFGDIGSLALAVTVLVMAFMMHRFWEETDAQAKQTEMAMFMKNLALAGGALVLFSFFAREFSGDFLPYTMTDGLFSF